MTFTRMKASVVKFYRECGLQLRILFNRGGRRELKIYRLERKCHPANTIWAPSKGRWVRARVYHWGFKYVRVRFVDGSEKRGKRSPFSVRQRASRLRGEDKPSEDARYSGSNATLRPTGIGISIIGMRKALATLMRGSVAAVRGG